MGGGGIFHIAEEKQSRVSPAWMLLTSMYLARVPVALIHLVYVPDRHLKREPARLRIGLPHGSKSLIAHWHIGQPSYRKD